MAYGSLLQGAERIAEAYNHTKVGVAAALGATEPTLHVHVGLLIFVLAWWLSKKLLASGWPVAAVIGGAVLNEFLDYLYQGLRLREACLDILLTVGWPLVITLMAKNRAVKN